jgi:polygalacturonase
MTRIYNAGRIDAMNSYYKYSNINIRTSLNSTIHGGESSGLSLSGTFNKSKIEIVSMINLSLSTKIWINDMSNMFYDCNKLKRIVPEINLRFMSSAKLTNTFKNCSSLEYINISQLKYSISFANSSAISKESVAFAIQNAVPTSAITITLHPDAYARFMGGEDSNGVTYEADSEIQNALTNQPLVSLSK